MLCNSNELLQECPDVADNVFPARYQVASIMQDALPGRRLPQLIQLIAQLLLNLPVSRAATVFSCSCIHMQRWQLQRLLLLQQLVVLRRWRHKPRCKDCKPWLLQLLLQLHT